MAKLTRKLKKIFSVNSPSDIGVWGSLNQTTSTDPDVIQSTGYETGISAAEVSSKKLMPRKDLNGVFYETSYHLAYLYQSGIPEYDAATTYYVDDIVRGDSTSFIYKSLVDNNVGTALTSASWLLCGDLATGLVNDNLADNGDFIIAQRGTSFTSSTTFTNDDGNYTLDRYKVGNSAGTTGVIDVSQITNTADLPDGARAAISLLHQQADKQAYIAQYYDNDTTKTLLNKDVSLSFEIYNSDSVTRNFRAAILSWQGTADNMPFYPVTTWQTANDLIFDSNFTIENTTTALTANATSWNRFTINGVNIDTANTNNLAVIIWTDEEMPNSYEWRATKVKLEQSSIATTWKARSVNSENIACQSVLATDGGVAGFYRMTADATQRLNYTYPTTMARNPTVTISNQTGNATIAVVNSEKIGYRLSFVGTDGELQNWSFFSTCEL
jgi:hypothetical protein